MSSIDEWFAGELRDEIHAAVVKAVGRIRTRHVSDRLAWPWGAVYQAHWQHLLSRPDRRWLDIGPEPVGGGAETLRNTGVGQPGFGPSAERSTASWWTSLIRITFRRCRTSAIPADPTVRTTVIQFADWLAGRHHVVSLRREDVERDIQNAVRLERAQPVPQSLPA